MKTLNPCRCGNNPERVTTSTGLVRISCVLGKCAELVCARADVAERAWNEANPCDDAPTLPQNAIPIAKMAEEGRVIYDPNCPPNMWYIVDLSELPTAIDVALPEDWSEV